MSKEFIPRREPILFLPRNAPFKTAAGFCGIDADGDSWVARYAYGKWARMPMLPGYNPGHLRPTWGEYSAASAVFAANVLHRVLLSSDLVALLIRRFTEQIVAKLSKRRFVLRETFITRWCARRLWDDGKTLRFRRDGTGIVL